MQEFNLFDLEPNDKTVLKQFAKGNCVGIFQFSSHGIIDLCKKIKIDDFEEIIASNALYRPGALGSGTTDRFPKKKFGKIKNINFHKIFDEITHNTYGELLYQEQIMEIVRSLGKFKISDVNNVRKLISKTGGKEKFYKDYSELFYKGCKENGLSLEKAKELFTQIETFGGYAFNKAHSCAYSVISYYTMWLKTYYPLEFMCASLNNVDKEEEIKMLIKECERLKLNLSEPDINSSSENFTIKNDTLYFGLSHIKNIGTSVVAEIIRKQPFIDFIDFYNKVDRKVVKINVIKSLIKAGAFSKFYKNNALFVKYFDEIVKFLKKKQKRFGYKIFK